MPYARGHISFLGAFFQGEGDCDRDNQCFGNLRCGENKRDNNCRGRGFDRTDDCCYRFFFVKLNCVSSGF